MKMMEFGETIAVDSWIRLQKVHQIIYRELQKSFSNKGITPAQFEVLIELNRHKVLPMCKISQLLAVTGGNITGLIDRLEKKGLVERERSEDDRRVIYARITDRGISMFRKVFGDFENNLTSILSSLGNDELGMFNDILERLFEGLNEKYTEENSTDNSTCQ